MLRKSSSFTILELKICLLISLIHGYEATAQDGVEWVNVSPIAPAPSPSPRHEAGMSYDESRRVTVLFGGYYDDGTPQIHGDTWKWNGSAQVWMQVSPSSSPAPRFAAAVAYDSRRERVVLFGGGDTPTTVIDDTWEWDGNAWLDATPDSPDVSPPGRREGAMAYCGDGSVLLFGGFVPYANPDRLDDTWEWDGSTWTHVSPEALDESPLPRNGHAMAYDAARGVVVLFGGHETSYGYYDDTWEWDCSAKTWLEVTPPDPATSPHARNGHDMVYDAFRGVVVLFGGSDGTNAYCDTWEWDGSMWTDVTPDPNEGPSARFGPAMAYDSAQHQVVLFGGWNWEAFFADTWECGPAVPIPTLSEWSLVAAVLLTLAAGTLVYARRERRVYRS